MSCCYLNFFEFLYVFLDENNVNPIPFPSGNKSLIYDKINSLPIDSGESLQCETDIYSEKFIIDGRKSFPSGHSSFSWMCFTFSALYTWGKLRAFVPRFRHQSFRFVSGFVFILPPLYISISRTQDYRHHWEDVLVGAIIGVICAYVSYHLYYPSLSDSFCYYSNRQIYWRKRDDQFSESGRNLLAGSNSSNVQGNVNSNDNLSTANNNDVFHENTELTSSGIFKNKWRSQRNTLQNYEVYWRVQEEP